MKIFFSLLIVAYCSLQSRAQVDVVGSGRAIAFDGVDDFIDLGNVYDDLSLPITLSVWINLNGDGSYAYPVFNSQDNLPLYNGVTFAVRPDNISVFYGDGRGENSAAFRRGKAADVADISGRWVNLTAIMRSRSDMDLYLNGKNMGGFYDGDTFLPMDSDSPGDDAKIGYWFSNGITVRFKGLMDELRIYDRSLSETEIRQQMCKRLSGNEPGLIGYWNFDETSGNTVMDQSPNQFHGEMQGNPTRVFSGAPVGDESVFMYSGDWLGKALAMDNLTVTNVSGDVFGVHIYSVNNIPSRTGGLDVSGIDVPYYGVFLADNGQNNTFDFEMENVCAVFQRRDNSQATWQSSNTFTSIHTRIEVISGPGNSEFEVDLGNDLTICGSVPYSLNTHVDPSGKTFAWSTGETSPEINISTSGTFFVKVTAGCDVDSDTIHVAFLSKPPAFSLGEDDQVCAIQPRVLATDLENDQGFGFTWHDGSTEKFFLADKFGTYWLKIENECGYAVDSITISQKIVRSAPQYNFISPNNQDDLNQFFILDDELIGSSLAVFNRWGKQVYESRNYQNNWDGDELPVGIYFYMVYGECIEPRKGSVTIMR